MIVFVIIIIIIAKRSRLFSFLDATVRVEFTFENVKAVTQSGHWAAAETQLKSKSVVVRVGQERKTKNCLSGFI